MTDPPATDLLEPDEAIFYEVAQSREPREFEFRSGDSVGGGSLRLVTGGELPGFATGLLMVSPGDDSERLAVNSYIEQISPFAIHREALAPASSVFLIVNATPFSMGVETPGAGKVIVPNAHTAIVLDESETLAVNIRPTVNTPPVAPVDVRELSHAFAAPASENGELFVFIASVTLQGTELAVETQSAGFRRLK